MEDKNKKKDKILEYLKSGIPACRIAEFTDIKCNRSYVYRIATEAVKNGILIKDDTLQTSNWYGRGKPIALIYKATGKEIDSSRRGSLFHYCRLYFSIGEKLTNIPKGRIIKFKNNQQIFFEVFQDNLKASFRICNMKTLIVAVSRPMDPKNFSKQEELEIVAQGAAAWFQRNYGGRLSLPLVKEAPHLSVPEDDQSLIEMLDELGAINQQTSWFDKSRGFWEWETEDERLLKIKASEPEMIMKLQDDSKSLRENQEKVLALLDGYSKANEELTKMMGRWMTPKTPTSDVEGYQ